MSTIQIIAEFEKAAKKTGISVETLIRPWLKGNGILELERAGNEFKYGRSPVLYGYAKKIMPSVFYGPDKWKDLAGCDVSSNPIKIPWSENFLESPCPGSNKMFFENHVLLYTPKDYLNILLELNKKMGFLYSGLFGTGEAALEILFDADAPQEESWHLIPICSGLSCTQEELSLGYKKAPIELQLAKYLFISLCYSLYPGSFCFEYDIQSERDPNYKAIFKIENRKLKSLLRMKGMCEKINPNFLSVERKPMINL